MSDHKMHADIETMEVEAQRPMDDIRPAKNIVVVSDLHVGCKLGLCPPSGCEHDEGGLYKPSRLQQIVWSYWAHFWNDVVPKITKGEKYDVVINGDSIDGVHHGAVSQWTHNIKDQRAAAEKILRPIADRAQHFFMTRGTDVHVGQSGNDEEALAKSLGAVPNNVGQHARYVLKRRIGKRYVHFAHHIGFTNSAHHEVSALNAELVASLFSAGRWGYEPPAILVRSHRHMNDECKIPAKQDVICFTTAAWQLTNSFGYRVMRGRTSVPQFGGSIIRLGDEELHTRHWNRYVMEDEPE